ncbi:GatB/YqeY domain-containing protein [Ruminiclostridium cellulolyticum]|uniref:GatB/Yqey domain protein n=1 Tax=Ruminiclostridium cellulolyticum (strain ATCC 35319 / DSM 5812 / JCM 6584 / H10) TaxID=394503 RepID=B8I405_RUMCH|nr:GatB/YqeY domain-containing protein [Ruminiclostridium cellulolyticum]ACL76438.1 GatB/Yqey domain protein [Ruminiclostridium cellulolyticum H10]
MSLKELLVQDLKKAMKDGDSVSKTAIQMARSAVLQVEKDTRVTLDDDGIVEIIAKEVKKRVDTLPDFEKSNRQDLIDNLKAEIEVLKKYLPQQLSEGEIEEIVKEAISSTGATSAKEIGKVMQAVMPKTRGKADGKLVNQIVKKLLE